MQSDSLSTLQAVHNLKYVHPISIKIHELYLQLTRDEEREISLSGHLALLALEEIQLQILLLRMPLMTVILSSTHSCILRLIILL